MREMENLLERLVVLNHSGTISVVALPARLTSGILASVTVAAETIDLGEGDRPSSDGR